MQFLEKRALNKVQSKMRNNVKTVIKESNVRCILLNAKMYNLLQMMESTKIQGSIIFKKVEDNQKIDFKESENNISKN